jgi:Tfp pilus assembly protein PilN
MIKVNLLRDHAVPTRHISVTPKASPMGWILLAALALVLAGVGGARYYLNQQVAGLTVNRDRLAVENTRLQDLRKQIDRYEKMRHERQSRIDIIGQLKENQTGPVTLMSHVIRSIPAGALLWLTNFEQKGERVRITGFTARGETIPDFMSNLSTTGYFKSVDLELYEDQQKEAAKFTLVCISASKAFTE